MNLFFTKMDNPIIDVYGNQSWYKDGKRHRDDGPAVISVNGGQYWYQNGKRHRDDGPAVIFADGLKQWYQNGVFIKETYENTSRVKSARN